MIFDFIVEEKTELKTFLKSKGFSARTVSSLLLNKKGIFINGKVYSTNYTLMPEDRIKIVFDGEKTSVKPVDKDICIIYEDEYFLVVNKPKNLSTIPSKLHYEDNLAGRVLSYYKKKNIESGIHIVNRLDYMTSGLVVFTKSGYIHSLMSGIDIKKKYCCTVKGIFENKEGTINLKIERVPGSVKRRVGKNGKEAITVYHVVKENDKNSVLDLEIKTGRTHQIRVHMAYSGHPLIGDGIYGDGVGDFDLCSYFLSFNFPKNNKNYLFEIEKPV